MNEAGTRYPNFVNLEHLDIKRNSDEHNILRAFALQYHGDDFKVKRFCNNMIRNGRPSEIRILSASTHHSSLGNTIVFALQNSR